MDVYCTTCDLKMVISNIYTDEDCDLAYVYMKCENCNIQIKMNFYCVRKILKDGVERL